MVIGLGRSLWRNRMARLAGGGPWPLPDGRGLGQADCAAGIKRADGTALNSAARAAVETRGEIDTLAPVGNVPMILRRTPYAVGPVP